MFTADNPIHLLASAAHRLQPTAVVETLEDDVVLYLEYQNLQDIQDSTLYDMSSNKDNEVAITFEEWKTKRKQFKQGNTLTQSLNDPIFLILSMGSTGCYCTISRCH